MAHGPRVFFSVIGKPFLTALTLPLLAALIAVSFADTNTDWAAVKAQTAAAAPWQAALVVTALVAVWCWMAGRALRRVWRQPMIRFLVRQPISRWGWVRYLIPNVCIGLFPAAVIGWLLQPRAPVVVHYVVLTSLAWPMLLGASYRGRAMVATYGGGAALFAALLTAYLYRGYWIYAALPALAIMLPLSAAPIARQLTIDTAGAGRSLEDFNPARVVARRDLRCLLRTERPRLLNLLLWTVLAPPLMLAFRINGAVEGREALLIAVVLFSIAASAVYDPMERLKLRLGKEVARLRWPISSADRAMALVLLCGALLAPSATLIGTFGSTMGYANGLAFSLFCLLTVVASACVFSAYVGTSRATLGQYFLALVGHGAIVFLVPLWLYVPLAAAGIVVAFRMTAGLLHRFAVAAEVAHERNA